MDYVTKDVLTDVMKNLNSQLCEFTDDIKEKFAQTRDRVHALEQRKSLGSFSPDTSFGTETLATYVSKSANLKALMGGSGNSARIDLPAGLLSFTKAAIVSQGSDLSPAMRVPGIVNTPVRTKRVRDLLPIGATGNNLVEFTREVTFTNAAAPQFSGGQHENVAKGESGITFELKEAPVRTLAHWIPVSKQVLSDSQQMATYLNVRLMEGLKIIEDVQILNGDGAGGNLSGILATGNNVAAPAAVVGENKADRLLRTIAALQVDEMTADGILLHPNDFAELQLMKSSAGEYLLGDPARTTEPKLWGVDVVVSTVIPAGTFLVGAWAIGAQLWDREQAAVQVSYEHGDNFTKNMATVLCEERLALTIYRPRAFRKGTF
jgi:HK97 family phage major capsid protein